MISTRVPLAVLAAIAVSGPAVANVIITRAATQNMDCSDGICVPTAAKAFLNANDLESDLSRFGNVRVMTTGSGIEAANIVVDAPFSSSDSTSLTLDAHAAITVNAAVSIGSGTAELELQSDTLDASDVLSFGEKGHITFGRLSDIFGINGGIFALVGSVHGLARAVAANPSGAFALANSYDASQDGTYAKSPIATTFSGSFEGLGNTIENLSLNDRRDTFVGLFRESSGRLSDIGVVNADVQLQRDSNKGAYALVGILAAYSSGPVSGSYVTGSVSGPRPSSVGGLVGQAYAPVVRSHANVAVFTAHRTGEAGGLLGSSESTVTDCWAAGSVDSDVAGGLVGSFAYGATVDQSFATARVSGSTLAGGLVGYNVGVGGGVSNSYATGEVRGTNLSGSGAGGLIGWDSNAAAASDSYSTGHVVNSEYVGGLIGEDNSSGGSLSNTYWDRDSSRIFDRSQGAGNIPSDPGIKGLTTKRLQSELPKGFSGKIWTEDPNINNGLPYLINNPPPK